MRRMYQLSAGGSDPIVDEVSREMFERGEIDEVRWEDWTAYCIRILNRIGALSTT